MRHFGDITKLNGAELPIVDIITGGSPCQDLSVAGKRAGLDGERSGLFMEQIRIVKEMREHDRAVRGTDDNIRGIRPRYMVWENVPGAFSSNKGKDFQAVLTEISRIVCKDCPDVPLPEKGKWAKSGCLMGYGDDGQPFSIAYRLHDSRYQIITPETNQTIPSIMCHDAAHGGLIMGTEEENNVETVVRRLTPMECERLQGFPDGWTDIGEWTDSKGKKHKDADSPRYKALGNSIALPYWSWMAERMVKQLKADGVENPTMASLFDGIGGFPLVYSRCGCQPLWASEIEEFPIAVTKIRFPEEES